MRSHVKPSFMIVAMGILGPYSTAVNFSIDLAGIPDTRASTWGNTGSAQNIVTFAAPAGYAVRVLSIYGDFIGFPRSGTPPAGTSCEIGWGLKTTAPDGSKQVSTGFDNSFVWLQNVVTSEAPACRASFNLDVQTGGLLGPDNTMISQVFVALNTTDLTIHMEPTFTMVYQFETLT